jgi:hypothetical protein
LTTRAVTDENRIEFCREPAVPVADQELNCPALAEVHEEVAGLLGGPGTSRMRSDAQDMHALGLTITVQRPSAMVV